MTKHGSKKVPCPACDHPHSVVRPWRSDNIEFSHHRRRECPRCHVVWETSEQFERYIRKPAA